MARPPHTRRLWPAGVSHNARHRPPRPKLLRREALDTRSRGRRIVAPRYLPARNTDAEKSIEGSVAEPLNPRRHSPSFGSSGRPPVLDDTRPAIVHAVWKRLLGAAGRVLNSHFAVGGVLNSPFAAFAFVRARPPRERERERWRTKLKSVQCADRFRSGTHASLLSGASRMRSKASLTFASTVSEQSRRSTVSAHACTAIDRRSERLAVTAICRWAAVRGVR